MFVGAQLAHLGERSGQTCQRPRAAFRFGAPRRVDVVAADDHLDLRQFALDGAGDAFDQRDAGGGRRIIEAIDGSAPAAHLPFIDRSARHFVTRIDGNRLGIHHHVGGRHGLVAFLDGSVPLRRPFSFQGSGGFRLRGFLDDTFFRRFAF
jgi:hypothetical protein